MRQLGLISSALARSLGRRLPRPSVEERFASFCRDNPAFLALFERFALDAAAAGLTRYSADAILHRIRWHVRVEMRGEDYRVNNDYAAGLARWFVARHPEHAGFFETRGAGVGR